METFKSLDELMSLYYPEQQYIVDRLIPDASITILSGQSRSFKTYTLLEIALSVAKGEPLFGQFSTQPTGVLMIDEENGERLLQMRFRQLGADTTDLTIYISSFSGFSLNDMNISEVISFCKEKAIRFVIIDALIRVHSADENSAREMSKVFGKLREFTKAGIAVLVTQHNRKAGSNHSNTANEMRGSSDILAAVDSHIGVQLKEKFYLTFTQEKQRYNVELDPFQVRVVADEKNFQFEFLGQLAQPASRSATLLSAVTALLTEHERLSFGELLDKIKEQDIAVNEHKLRELLVRWVQEGAIEPPVKDGKGNTKYYQLGGHEDE